MNKFAKHGAFLIAVGELMMRNGVSAAIAVDWINDVEIGERLRGLGVSDDWERAELMQSKLSDVVADNVA